MMTLDKNKIYYVRHENKIVECKFINANIYASGYGSGTYNGGYYGGGYNYSVQLPDGTIKKADYSWSLVHGGYGHTFQVYRTLEDCKNGTYPIEFLSYPNWRYWVDKCLENGTATRTNAQGIIMSFYWDGYTTKSRDDVGSLYYFPLTQHYKFVPSKGTYSSKEECDKAHSVDVVTFADNENKKRVEELETIIRNAQAELAKINK